MTDTSYSSHLRYLDAKDVDDSTIDFDGLDVRGWEHDKLGDLDGFIVDGESGRLYYAVVDSGGWFHSRQFLLPIGHINRIDAEKKELDVDLSKDAVRHFPDFDGDRFGTLSDEELREFERRTSAACCPDEGQPATGWGYDSHRHYVQPTWWPSEKVRADRTRATGSRGWRAAPDRPVSPPATTIARPEAERVTAHERSAGDVSPHFDGRAQPGDVVGIETGGERTYIGDLAETENERRESAERDAPPARPDDER
ncbi:MAG TPA: PRC-barrel domain-containing protein [Vicinamibacterales bacterium]|nr:PRC-barrel domain-containing protein [Vicinamibacterales bacterium]